MRHRMLGAVFATLLIPVQLLAVDRPYRPDQVRVDPDRAYGLLPAQRLDVCVPLAPGPARPAVVLIHGGSWFGGDRASLSGVCTALAQDGIVTVNAEYRLVDPARPDTLWPAALDDVRAAVGWLRAHAATLRVDPARICAYGESAGGQLAVFLGVGPAPAVSCVVDAFGPVDMTQDAPLQRAGRMLLGLPADPPPDARDFLPLSPLFLAGPGSAAMLILQGTDDTLVPPAGSRALRDRLQRAGVAVTYLEYAGTHNWVGLTAPQRLAIHDRVAQFLRAAH